MITTAASQPVTNNFIPFKVLKTELGICNSAVAGSANPEITIDNNGTTGSFVVTSILMKTVAPPGIPTTGFRFLRVNNVTIDGVRFDTGTGNLTGPTSGTGVAESFDIMGTPVIRSADIQNTSQPGGNFPLQIVADSAGDSDIRVRLFCRSDDQDLNFDSLIVSGWKLPDDTVTVTYTPGN
jgi:hypothetical protein